MAFIELLEIGTELEFDGEIWKIEAFVDGAVRLRSNSGKVAVATIGALSSGAKFAHSKETVENLENEAVTFPDSASAESITTAETLLEHLNEVETGYKSGFLGTALPHEPRQEYDVEGTTLSQRMEAKAKELGVDVRTIWNYKAAYKKSGIYGLLDQRHIRLAKIRTDHRVIEALHYVVAEITDHSTLTNQEIARRVKKHLSLHHGEVPFPSESTFNRLIKRETKNKGLKGSAKGRRSINNRPETTYKRFYATRPGELVLIDSTPLDAFAMNPVDFSWVPIQLTIAMCLSTRSIVAWRFTPVSTKAVDAALLLYDIIRPKAMLKGWPESARWNYIGVPENIVVELFDVHPEHGVAGVPVLHPESVMVDRGKVFISQTFKDACWRLGINLQLARPYTPTDKAHVERAFLTIRNNFVMSLPGYKGPDVYSRGLAPEAQVFYFIDEIEEKFAEWIATWWQRRHHEGLDLPSFPSIKMSPNDSYNEGLSRAGFVHMISNENMYYELLPTAWRKIQHYGIDFDGLRYDGDILNEFRNKESPYVGPNARKWPIRHDPRDRSTAYFFDHETCSWHPLHWVHDNGRNRPFNESVLGYAKALVIARQGNAGNSEELAEVLSNILDKLDVSDEDRRVRRMLAVNKIHAVTVEKNRPENANRFTSKVTAPDDDAVMVDMGTLYGAPFVPTENAAERTQRRGFRNVDDFNEDDDDDLEVG